MSTLYAFNVAGLFSFVTASVLYNSPLLAFLMQDESWVGQNLIRPPSECNGGAVVALPGKDV
jgi:hypothetical protein